MNRKTKQRKNSSPVARALALRTGSYAGRHGNRAQDVRKGRSRKAKHKGGTP